MIAALAVAQPGAASPEGARLAPQPERAALAVPVERRAGPDRVGTAVEISRAAFPSGAGRAFLARADVLADALAAGVLTEGPVLLVPSCGEVPPAVAAELDRLRPARVTALGGPAAVCDGMLRAAASGRAADRLAGSSRLETAVEVARAAFPDGAEEVYLARSTDSPDAVAGGSLTAGPILLVPGGQAPAVVVDEIARLDPARVVVLGGPAAVADETGRSAAGSRPWIRLAGADRAATAAAISAYRFGVAPGESAPRTSEAGSAYLARSDVFADAVAAGSLTDGPVFLVPSCGSLPGVVASELDRLRPARVVALGGPAAVCEATLQAAASAVPADLEIPDTTVVLGAEDDAALTSYDDARGVLVFDERGPDVQPGDVLVSRQTEEAPEGILGRVTAVSPTAGGLRVDVLPAAVTDAVTAGFGVARQPLTLAAEVPTGTPGVTVGPAQVAVEGRSAQALEAGAGIRWRFDDDVVLYDVDGDRSTTRDQVVVSGEVVLAGEMTGVLDVGTRGLRPAVERFAFAAELREEADLDVRWGTSLDAAARLTFGPYPLPGFVIPVGPVTVPVNPQLLLTISATGEVSASVSVAADQELSYRVGAEYRQGRGWTPLGSARNDWEVGRPELNADATATLSTTVRVPFKVASVAGPALEAEAYLRGEASLTPVDWSLTAGLRGRAGFDVSFPVLGAVASFTSQEVFRREWPLAEYEPVGLDLTETAVGPVPLGTPREEARQRLFALLGPPDTESLDYGCGLFGPTDGAFWQWGDLIVTADDDLFEDGVQRLEGWAVNAPASQLPPGTRLPYGLVPGVARAADIERALAPDFEFVTDPSVFGDFYVRGDLHWFLEEGGDVLQRVDMKPVFCD